MIIWLFFNPWRIFKVFQSLIACQLKSLLDCLLKFFVYTFAEPWNFHSSSTIMDGSPCKVTTAIDRDALYTICCSGLTRLLEIEDLEEFLHCENDHNNQTRHLSRNITTVLKKKSLQLFNMSHVHHGEKLNKKGQYETSS